MFTMPLHKTAHYNVKPESVEKIKKILREYVAFVRQNEPDTLYYIVMQDKVDLTSFTHFGIYRDAAAQQKHNDGAKYYADQLWAETPEPATFVDYELVVAKDS